MRFMREPVARCEPTPRKSVQPKAGPCKLLLSISSVPPSVAVRRSHGGWPTEKARNLPPIVPPMPPVPPRLEELTPLSSS